jgi:hypothetical protein
MSTFTQDKNSPKGRFVILQLGKVMPWEAHFSRLFCFPAGLSIKKKNKSLSRSSANWKGCLRPTLRSAKKRKTP